MMKKPVMYLFLNRGLGMSTGKSAAQVAHAAVEAYRISHPTAQDAWYFGGHYTKLVMLAENAEQLDTFERYINERGFKTGLIIDEGRTEIKPFSKTALGVEIVDKADEHVIATFGEFKTYRDLTVPLDVVAAYEKVGNNRHLNWRGREYKNDGLPVAIINRRLNRGG